MKQANNIKERAIDNLRRPVTWLLLAWLFSFVIVLVRTVPVSSDGIYYYAYLRSIVLDHDVNFANDLAPFAGQTVSGASISNPHVIKQLESGVTTPAGRTPNLFSIGPAIVWSPFFVITHGIAKITGSIGLTGAVADGFTKIELLSPSIATSLYGLLGLLFACGLLVRALPTTLDAKHKQKIAAGAVLAIMFGTNLFYYLTFEASMSHGVGFFAVTLLIWAWQRWRLAKMATASAWQGIARWLMIGLLAGLVVAVRWQLLLVVLVIPGVDLTVRLIRALVRKKWSAVRDEILRGGLVLLGAVIVFAPQLFAWRYLYGSWLVIPQGSGFLDWTSPNALAVLFSTRHGLFSWTPLILVAVLGVVLALVRRKQMATLPPTLPAYAIAIFLLQIYINGAAIEWWGGDAFGARRFTDISIVFMFGLAFLFAQTTTVWARRALATVVTILIVANLLFMQAYRHNLISHAEPVAIGQATTAIFGLFR